MGTPVEEAEKALIKAAEDAVSAASDLVKQRITQEGKLPVAKKGVKEAFALATDLIKQQITLAMGAIVFSGTLLKDKQLILSRWLLLSWLAWGLSMLLGLIAMGRVITLTSEGNCEEMDKGLGWVGMFQQLFLVAGVILFAIFVFRG